MSQPHLAKLKSTAGTGYIIYTRRNKKSTQTKLNLRKFDPKVRKHVEFKEMKK